MIGYKSINQTKPNNMEVRIDKYLWSIRIFKTRALAAEACDKGKVVCKEKEVKASYKVKPDDIYHIRILPVYTKEIKVKLIIDKRVGADKAKECYDELSPPYVPPHKEKDAFFIPSGTRDKGTGRPTKKDRRDIGNKFDF